MVIMKARLSVKSGGMKQTVCSNMKIVIRMQGLSVPDAEMLISISEVFDTPVSTILGENIDEQEKKDLKVI